MSMDASGFAYMKRLISGDWGGNFPIAIKSVLHRAMLAGGCVCIVGVSGCAVPTISAEPGTPLTAVVAKYGQPSYSCQLPDGTKRLIWSTFPNGSANYATQLRIDGSVNFFEQVLTDKHFELLDEGHWSPEQVECEFGPPYQIAKEGLDDKRQVVWSYRYLSNQGLNDLMNVYLGPDGKRVTSYSRSQDYGRGEPEQAVGKTHAKPLPAFL
jgi:hypothetical protein